MRERGLQYDIQCVQMRASEVATASACVELATVQKKSAAYPYGIFLGIGMRQTELCQVFECWDVKFVIFFLYIFILLFSKDLLLYLSTVVPLTASTLKTGCLCYVFNTTSTAK